MTLEDAIDATISKPKQSSSRLDTIADYAIERLDAMGLPDVAGGSAGELPVNGLARTKNWDVAYNFVEKPRLLISLKSVWKNASGSVPNRIDDLIGESANVQQRSPEVVIGYILLFEVGADSQRRDDNLMWSEHFERAVDAIAIRRSPLWNQGLLEGAWFIRFDKDRPKGSRVVDPMKTRETGLKFFRSLLCELELREPAIPFTRRPDCEPSAAAEGESAEDIPI
ncbi:MAG: hypothetical protein AAF845_06340 [Bacteroidota bacterium]